jgi:hypothetical protein
MDFEIISIHKHGHVNKRIRYVNDDRYMNTSIYKIQCKDETVEDMYIGHTTNFEKRNICHMIETETSITKVYKFIRSHGGWDNWNMIILANYTCKNRGHASRLEWYWWNKIGGSLNYTRPGINYIMRDMKKHADFTSYINDMELLCRISSPICDSTA